MAMRPHYEPIDARMTQVRHIFLFAEFNASTVNDHSTSAGARAF